VRALPTITLKLTGDAAKRNQCVYGLLLEKQALLERVRRDMRYQAMLDVWLLFHVPLTFALLATLLAHIVSVLVYR
jgi:hypothetical protein